MNKKYVYVLQLEQGRVYVGSTTDPTRRFNEHLSGNGSAWTRKYRPLGFLSPPRHVNDALQEEEDETDKQIEIHGAEYVRGGSRCQITPHVGREAIQSARYANNTCFKCGGVGHWARECTRELARNSSHDQPSPQQQYARASSPCDKWITCTDCYSSDGTPCPVWCAEAKLRRVLCLLPPPRNVAPVQYNAREEYKRQYAVSSSDRAFDVSAAAENEYVREDECASKWRRARDKTMAAYAEEYPQIISSPTTDYWWLYRLFFFVLSLFIICLVAHKLYYWSVGIMPKSACVRVPIPGCGGCTRCIWE